MKYFCCEDSRQPWARVLSEVWKQASWERYFKFQPQISRVPVPDLLYPKVCAGSGTPSLPRMHQAQDQCERTPFCYCTSRQSQTTAQSPRTMQQARQTALPGQDDASQQLVTYGDGFAASLSGELFKPA